MERQRVEKWAQEVLASFRDHEVDRFEDLPEMEKARLHSLAALVWPAAGRVYGQVGQLTPYRVIRVWDF